MTNKHRCPCKVCQIPAKQTYTEGRAVLAWPLNICLQVVDTCRLGHTAQAGLPAVAGLTSQGALH